MSHRPLRTTQATSIVATTTLTALLIALMLPLATADAALFDNRKLPASCANPTRIMPLGDSITQGSSSGVVDPEQWISYRYTLWHALEAGGYHVDFVGGREDGEFYTPLDGFDANHQGAPGATDFSVANGVIGWLTDTPADVVLLHVGINNVDTDPTWIQTTLERIDTVDEDIVVVLARIANRVAPIDTVTQFNDAVEAMALDRIANGDRIVLVDIESGAGLIYAVQPAGDMWDALHPFETGYDKMAAVWYSGLQTVNGAYGVLPVCFFAPTVTSTPVTTALVNEPYGYTIETDVDYAQSPTIFTLLDGPSGMSVDSASGQLSWTPGTTGQFNVQIEARNFWGADTQTYTLTVNRPPDITSEPVTNAIVGDPYSYAVSANGTPAPVYSLDQAPSGMSIDPASGQITWTPIAPGTADVTVRATNSAGSDTQQFSIDVLERPIVTAPDDIEATVGIPITVIATATGVPAPTFSLDSAPAGMQIDANSGAIHWTPDTLGTATVVVRASNSVGSSTASFEVTVTPVTVFFPILLQR